MAGVTIREMTLDDYEKVVKLWQDTEGIGLSEADTRENIAVFLQHNAGLSVVAEGSDGEIFGTVLCGHDSRRGYLHHVCVSSGCRKQGIGQRLVDTCLARLREQGIKKCHLFVFTNNEQGMEFWRKMEFTQRADIGIFSREMTVL